MNEKLEHAERNLVGTALIDPDVHNTTGIRSEHFYNPKHSAIWTAIGERLSSGDAFDPLTLEVPPAVRVSDLSELVAAAGPSSLSSHWATIVHDAWVHRQLSLLAASTSELSAPDAVTTVRTRLEAIEAAADRGLPRLGDMLSVDYNDPGGLLTGIGIERVAPGGIPRGRVTLIQGETGNFKSTVANNIVWNIAEQGYPVLAVPLEDSNEFNRDKFLSRYTGIPFGLIGNASQLNPQQREQLEKVVTSEKAARASGNIIMGGDIPPNIDEIIRLARYHRRNDGIVAVLIDYIQLIEAEGSQYEQLVHIMRKLQNSARSDGLAYIVVSQVKQDVDQRDDHRPRITDALGGSALRMASKLLIGVHRPSKYEPEPKKRSPYREAWLNKPGFDETYKGLIELHVLKNASGEADTILHAHVDPPTGVIRPLTKDDVL